MSYASPGETLKRFISNGEMSGVFGRFSASSGRKAERVGWPSSSLPRVRAAWKLPRKVPKLRESALKLLESFSGVTLCTRARSTGWVLFAGAEGVEPLRHAAEPQEMVRLSPQGNGGREDVDEHQRGDARRGRRIDVGVVERLDEQRHV